MIVLLFLAGIFIMTASGAFGALFLKNAMRKMERLRIKKLLMTSEVYYGGLFYLIGAVFNILLLRDHDYTLIYPMTSLTYVWTIIISVAFLHEKLNKKKIAAILCIVAGASLISI